MTTALRRVLSVAAFAAYAGCSALYAAAPPPAKPASKPSLRLKANSIIFDRSKGDIYLEGKVHVTRTLGDQVTVIECEKMTAKMKDGKMESVLATGTVNLTTKELTAVAARASFDFTKNIIVLHGWNDKPATAKSPRTVSTGPKIIYHVDDQRVEMPEGGVTEVELEEPPEEKDKTGKKEE